MTGTLHLGSIRENTHSNHVTEATTVVPSMVENNLEPVLAVCDQNGANSGGLQSHGMPNGPAQRVY